MHASHDPQLFFLASQCKKEGEGRKPKVINRNSEWRNRKKKLGRETGTRRFVKKRGGGRRGGYKEVFSSPLPPPSPPVSRYIFFGAYMGKGFASVLGRQ